MLKYDVLHDEYKDEDLARIKLTSDKWNGIIYHYHTVQFVHEEDDEAVLKFDYDIVESPAGMDVDSLTEEDHTEFETLLGDILVEIITEVTVDENRTDNLE
tara:strand:+ start:147 stop:449 length:303 start_codon:yes stop_codon:yes gene_type:complete